MSAPLVPALPPLARSVTRSRLAAWLAVAAFALLALPVVLPSYQVSIATQILIFSVLAMSIDVLAGFAGRTPLGHGAIFGISTYVVIYWTANLGGSVWIGMLLGVLAATLLAVIFALLAIRTSGVYFLLLTLALGMIVWGVCLRFVHSPFGLTLRGIRDSESRMRSLGYNVPLHLFIAFVGSGFFAGIAGALYALFNDFVSPSTVQLSQSVAGLLMAITGGIGTLLGSFVGATAIILLENVVSVFTARWQTVLGLTFIVIMIFAPEGMVGRARILLARGRRATPT
jgi:branched-chain amino acid transport system permease protein